MLQGKKTKASLWLFASGIIIILLGIYVWLHPATALLALALYLGVIMVITGLAYIVAFMLRSLSWYLALGLLNIFVGIIFILNLGVTAETLPIMFGFWSLFIGVTQIASSYNQKGKGLQWVWPLFSGVLGVLFAFLILSYPFIGTIAITVLMGSYMILYGAFGILECTTCRRDEDDI